MQHEFDTEKSLWKRLVIDPEFKTLQKHIDTRVEVCRLELEIEDNLDARAEIRVLRNILLNAETYRDDN